MDVPLILVLVLAVAFVTWVLARRSLRNEPHRPRGLDPGTGDHIIEVNYSSGVGGGEQTEIRVPKDPQEYAKAFVPKGKRK